MTKVYTTLRIVLLGCFIAHSVVEADVVLQVTADNVNLRAIADGEAEVLSQVSRGAILHTDSFEGGDWIEVAVPDGVSVWVYSELVRDNTVAVSKLSVRSGPGINYRTVGMLRKGDKVISHGVLNGWLKISAPINCRVWISSKYVALANDTIKKPIVKPVVVPKVKPVIKPKLAKPIIVKPVVKPLPDISAPLKAPVPTDISAPLNDRVKKPLVKAPVISVPLEKPSVVTDISAPLNDRVKELPEKAPVISVPLEKPSVVTDISASGSELLRPDKPLNDRVKKPPVKANVKKSELPDETKICTTELVSEVIPTPEMIIVPVFSDTEAEVLPDEHIAVSNVTRKMIVEPIAVIYEKPVDKVIIDEESAVAIPVVVKSEQVDEVSSASVVAVDIEPEEDDMVVETIVVIEQPEETESYEPVIAEINDVDKIFNTNGILRGIDSLNLVTSMEQGYGVVLNGRLKSGAGRNKPSRYRLVNIGGKRGSTATCYVMSDNDNLDKFIGAFIKVQGKAYRVKGVRQMVVLSENIKRIPVVPVLH